MPTPKKTKSERPYYLLSDGKTIVSKRPTPSEALKGVVTAGSKAEALAKFQKRFKSEDGKFTTPRSQGAVLLVSNPKLRESERMVKDEGPMTTEELQEVLDHVDKSMRPAKVSTPSVMKFRGITLILAQGSSVEVTADGLAILTAPPKVKADPEPECGLDLLVQEMGV